MVGEWIIVSGPGTQVAISEERLQHAVAHGRMSGLELVRAANDPQGPMVPVHALPWFAAVAGAPAGTDLAAFARTRSTKRGLRIVGMFMGSYFSLATFVGSLVALGNGKPGALGAAAVAGGAVAILTTAFIRRRRANQRRFEAVRAGPIAVARPIVIHQHDELGRVIDALEADLATGRSPLAASLASPQTLRRCAEQLREQRAVLKRIVDANAPERRQKELEEARAKIAVERDQRLLDALADQVRALEQHDAAMVRAQTALVENAARARALLHEIEGLRLAVARAGIDVRIEDATVDRLAELQRRITGEADVARAIDEEIEQAVRPQAQKRTIGP